MPRGSVSACTREYTVVLVSNRNTLLTLTGCLRTSRSMLSSTQDNWRTHAITFACGNNVLSNCIRLHQSRLVSKTMLASASPGVEVLDQTAQHRNALVVGDVE